MSDEDIERDVDELQERRVLGTKSYTLRKIPAELHAEFKSKAAKDGEDMVAVLLQLMQLYVDGRVELGLSN